MNLKDIAAIAGKPGLYRIIKPTRTGIIVETIGNKTAKTVVNANQRVSILKEISVYTTGARESVPLTEIFTNIKTKFDQKISIDTNSTPAMMSFLGDILPEYDKDKVYPSDVKKMIGWYNMLVEFYPEAFTNAEEEEETAAANN